jgi:predicted ATPase
MDKKLILLIGGPGTGKTTIINQLTEKGFCCYPEISREVTLAAQKNGTDQLFLSNPLLFSELLLQGRINQFKNAINEPHKLVFIDRGIPDVLAYMNFIGDIYPNHFETACKNYIYNKIFVLPVWKEIYISDNERYENLDQAIEIQKHLVETYKKYGYNLIEVPKDTVQNRIDFILENLD